MLVKYGPTKKILTGLSVMVAMGITTAGILMAMKAIHG
jgi:hypothetical protein